MPQPPLRVLFLCTGNAARSQMAEALLRHLSHGRADVFSAGSAPASEIHPLARAALEDKYRIDTAALHPKSMSGFLSQRFDFAITVCDRTAENCPVFPGDPQRIHWSFEDPVTIPDLEARRRAFEQIANGLSGRLRIWMSLPEIQRRLRGESTPDHSRSHPADDAL